MSDDFPILAGVAIGPAYPYQLLEFLGERGIRATRSTLYRRVDALVADGLLLARELRGERGHIRRTLELTSAGRTRLAQDTPTALRDEALESPFFGLALDCIELAHVETDLEAVIGERLEQAEHQLRQEERSGGGDGAALGHWARAGNDRRVAHLRADIAWMRESLGSAARDSDYAEAAAS